MRKFALVAMVVLLAAATSASAQMADQPEPGTITMTENGAHQEAVSVVGKIKEIDLTNRVLTLDDGTQFTLPDSLEYSSFPRTGDQVDVTYGEQGMQKTVRWIDVQAGGNSKSGSSD
jgi:hypothetical protein